MILLFFFLFFSLDRSDRRDLTAEPVKVAAFRRANRTKARESRGGWWESEWLAFVEVNAFMLVSVSADRRRAEEGWESGTAPSRESNIASRPALSVSHRRGRDIF